MTAEGVPENDPHIAHTYFQCLYHYRFSASGSGVAPQ